VVGLRRHGGVVVAQHRGPLVPQALADGGERGADDGVRCIELEHQVALVFRADLRRAAGIERQDAGGVGDRQRGQLHRRGPYADHGVDVLDIHQFPGGQHGGVGTRLVVFGVQLELAPGGAAGGVHFGNADLDRFQHARPVGAASARDRVQGPHLERRGTALGEHRPCRAHGGQGHHGLREMPARSID